MKKKLSLLVLIFILNILVVPKAFAATAIQTCTYTFDSQAFGYNTAKVEVFSAKDWDNSLIIDMFNGKVFDRDGEDIVNGKNIWEQFIRSGNKCPPYLFLKSGEECFGCRWWGYLGYDYNGLYQEVAASEDDDTYEQDNTYWHILESDTLATDYPAAEHVDTTLVGTDKLIDKNKELRFHCLYNTTARGYSSGAIDIYKDGTYKAYSIVIQGVDNTYEVHDLDNWDAIKAGIDSRDCCPYYMVFDDKNINQITAGFTVTELALQEDFNIYGDNGFFMVSKTIKEDKEKNGEPYDPNVDGKFKTKEDYEHKAWNGGAKVEAIEWDPDDPYNFHVGDEFCGEERLVKLLKALGMVILLAKFVIPMMIALWGAWDFLKVVTSGEKDTLKKQAKNFGLRIVIGLFVFFVPSLTYAFFSGLSYYNVISQEINQCQACLLNPTDDRYCEYWTSSTTYTPTIKIGSPDVPDPRITTGSSGGGNGASDTGTNGNTPQDTGNKKGSCTAKNVFTKLDYNTASSQLSAQLSAAQTGRDRAVAAANYLATNFPNLPYHWGGYTEKGINDDWGSCKVTSTAEGHKTAGTYQPYGMDCSGFVSWVMHQAGYKDGHKVSGEWGSIVSEKYEITGKKSSDLVSMGVKVGDLVWHKGHIGIIIGKDSKGFIIAHEKGYYYPTNLNGLVKEYLDDNIKGCGKDNSSNFTHVLLMDKYYNKKK